MVTRRQDPPFPPALDIEKHRLVFALHHDIKMPSSRIRTIGSGKQRFAARRILDRQQQRIGSLAGSSAK